MKAPGTGQMSFGRADTTITGVMTFHVPEKEGALLIEFTGQSLGHGVFNLKVTASDHLISLTKALSGSAR